MPAKRVERSALPKLAAPAMRALNAAGITTLTQVARKSKKELLALHGMGPNAIQTLESAVAKQGRALKE